MLRPAAALLALLVAAAAAAAQPVVTSPAPDSVEVTVYRDPHRSPAQEIDLDWLDGFALISEKRRISIPAGESEVRFEGVAGGILPQSAIVTGFPDGIVERNRDAYLLSPATLLDRSLGRRVTIRRTSEATGDVVAEEAVIRSSADGAVVLQTAAGFEALRCSGLAETIVYDAVPEGLSARPTLSVRTRSAAAVEATVTLSYLASGFDWQADYVASLAPDRRSLRLFAWLTLASMDETSFVDADAQAVAGRLNREHVEVPEPEAGALRLRCWPHSRTDQVPEIAAPVPPPPPPPPPPPAMMAVQGEPITVTGSRLQAVQEDLGDLKLYRIPEPVTVAANSQKQVALLDRAAVAVDLVHRARIDAGSASDEWAPATFTLVATNRASEGLGIPLPAGQLRLFDEALGRPILLGGGVLRDHAVGEEVEVGLSEASGVRWQVVELDEEAGAWTWYELNVASDHGYPVRFEAELVHEDYRFRSRTRLSRRDGRPLWTVSLPANGRASLRYRLADPD